MGPVRARPHAARGLRRRVRLGGAVGVVRCAVATLPVPVRVLRLAVVRRHRRGLLTGVPATVVLLVLRSLLGIRVMRLLRLLLPIRVLGVRVVLLRLPLLRIRVLRVRVLRRAVLLVLLMLGVHLLRLLLGVGVLRIGLLRAAVLALAVGSLLAVPSLVPIEGILGMPRFGAGAPAILSHRSPRAARRTSASLLCGVCSNTAASRGTLPYRDQTTTSTPSPGALPDARSDSRAFWRITTAAA